MELVSYLKINKHLVNSGGTLRNKVEFSEPIKREESSEMIFLDINKEGP